MVIRFVFINDLSKSAFLNEKPNVKTIEAETAGSRTTILGLRIQSCPSDPTIPFKLCSRRFPIKNAFAMTISKAQGQTLKRATIYPTSSLFPMASSVWNFPEPFYFTRVLQ
jgi:ATP-dependent exoDNAse (exonuclease V), alpha subunit - helicase superfamily I member